MTTEAKNMEIQILEVAERLFVEQGFFKTTMEQIARETGCNKALVHYYYRSKDKLFDRIFEEKAKFLMNNILNLKGEATTFLGKLEERIVSHFEFLKNNKNLIPFLYNEVLSNPKRIKILSDKMQSILVNSLEEIEKELQEEIEKGNICSISFHDIYFTIISLNVMPFFLRPIITIALQMDEQQMDLFLEHRKKETLKTIFTRLKP